MLLSQRTAFVFHMVAGTLTGLLLLVPIVGASFSPVDIFARPQSFLVGHLQFLLAAVVFYGFSAVTLRLVPLATGWSVLYTAVSWLFFLWAFYPVVSSSGMMRRIVGSWTDYQAAEQRRERWHLAAIFIFGCIQVLYLLYVISRQKTAVQA